MRSLAAATAAIGIAPDADGIDAIVYGFTDRVLVVIVVQLSLVAFAILPVSLVFTHFFVPFNLILDGFALKIGPAAAVAVSVVFGFVGSFWQFATILSIRSYPLEAHAQSPKGHHSFIPVAIVGALLTLALITVGGVLLGTKSYWKEPIEKNFGILLKAASIDDDAASELNRLQMLVDCCGMMPDVLFPTKDANNTENDIRDWHLPTRLAAFEPFATWFDAKHFGPSIRAAKNLPFSCCRRDSVNECHHLNLDPIVRPRNRDRFLDATKLPDLGSSDPTVALSSLNTAEPCPERIFEMITWEFNVFCGSALLAVGIVALVGTGALVLAQLRVSKATKAFLESGKVPSTFGLKTIEVEADDNVTAQTPNTCVPTSPATGIKSQKVSTAEVTN